MLAATGGCGLLDRSKEPVQDPYYPGDAAPGPTVTPKPRPPVAGTSPVSRENARAGTGSFKLLGHRFADDLRMQVAGYASATSVAVGGDLEFNVSVTPAQDYQIRVYRLGHYGGSGARLVATSPWLPGRQQPVPTVDAETGMVGCGWDAGWRLRIGRDWTSGYYLALLANAAGWHQWIPFVVRDPTRSAAGLVIVPTSTYQAYNMWPRDGRTGASLYYGHSAAGKKVTERRSNAVSHDRPYVGNGIPNQAGRDVGYVQWSEQYGYDVTYASSEDLHTARVRPDRYRAVIFCGHDEYWSVEMRRSVAAARDSGTSLVFLGANNCYWRVRYGGSATEPDERIVSCAKSPQRVNGRVALMTQWRKAGSPEQELIGAQYVSVIDDHAPLVVRDSGHWFWAGTGLRDGDEIPKVVWGEADQVMSGVSNPRSTESAVLAASAYSREGQARHQNTHLYRAPSGAWVFAAGTLGWTAVLQQEGFVDLRLRQATRNLLDRVLGGSS